MAYTGIIQNSTPQLTSPLPGMNLDVNLTQFPLQNGVPLKSIYTYEFVPCTVKATSLSLSNDPTGDAVTGFQPLLTTSTTSGTGISNVSSTYVESYLGVPTIFFDVEQCPAIYLAGGHIVAQDCTVYFTGVDYRGIPVTSTISIAAASATGRSYVATTPMLGIQSIYIAGTLGTGIAPVTATFGGSSVYGLPYYLPSVGNVLAIGSRNVKGNAGTLYSTANITASIVAGNNWRNNAPSSILPARGYFSASSLALVPDGNTAIAITYYIQGGDSELQNMLQNAAFDSVLIDPNVCLNAYGLLGAKLTDSGTKYAYPYVLSQDLTGLQYASNSTTSIGSVSTTSPDSIFYTNYASYLANN